MGRPIPSEQPQEQPQEQPIARNRAERIAHEEHRQHMAYINAQDNDGWTALHHGATTGDTDIARILIEAGVDPRTRDVENRTAADVARDRGHETCADYIDSAIDSM